METAARRQPGARRGAFADRPHPSRPLDYLGGCAAVHVRSRFVAGYEPSPGEGRGHDDSDAAFLAERQDSAKRAGLKQRVSARDREQVEVDQVGNALGEPFVGAIFPTVGVLRFEVAPATDCLDATLVAQRFQCDRATAAVAGEFVQVLLGAFDRLIAVVEVVNGERIDGGRADPLQRITVLLKNAVVCVVELEAKPGGGVPGGTFRSTSASCCSRSCLRPAPAREICRSWY